MSKSTGGRPGDIKRFCRGSERILIFADSVNKKDRLDITPYII